MGRLSQSQGLVKVRQEQLATKTPPEPSLEALLTPSLPHHLARKKQRVMR